MRRRRGAEELIVAGSGIVVPAGGPGKPRTVRGGTGGHADVPGRATGRPDGFGSELEAILANRIALAGLPKPETQYKFCPTRKWRADFAYPSAMLLIEVDGGAWTAGRHVRGKGFEADCEKTSVAAALGYRYIRVTRSMIESGLAVALIRQALEVLA